MLGSNLSAVAGDESMGAVHIALPSSHPMLLPLMR